MITVFACESHPIVVEGLVRVFEGSQEFLFCGASALMGDANDAVRELRPQVVLIDQMFGSKGISQFAADCRTLSPNSHAVLWVNELAEVECFRMLQIGVRGVLKKTAPVPVLLDCARSVAAGTVWVETPVQSGVSSLLNRRGTPRLTPRELEIVHHVCRGLKNKEIADNLSITAGTVKVHLMHIFEKTGVKDRFELAVHGRKFTTEIEVPG